MGEGQGLPCASHSQLWTTPQQSPKETAGPGGLMPEQVLPEQTVAHGGPIPEHRKRVRRKEE